MFRTCLRRWSITLSLSVALFCFATVVAAISRLNKQPNGKVVAVSIGVGSADSERQKLAEKQFTIVNSIDPSGFVEAIEIPGPPQVDAKSRAASHPHGNQMCASGCALSHHPTPVLAINHFDELMQQYSSQRPDQSSQCLDELIFYGPQTVRMLDGGGGYGLEIAKDETRVLKEEAVGMYDVAVLQAGSSQALERWMTLVIAALLGQTQSPRNTTLRGA